MATTQADPTFAIHMSDGTVITGTAVLAALTKFTSDFTTWVQTPFDRNENQTGSLAYQDEKGNDHLFASAFNLVKYVS